MVAAVRLVNMKKFTKTFKDPVQGNGVKIEVTNFAGDRNSPRIRVVCRDCDSRLDIYGRPGDPDEALEIGGVYASKEMWRRILLPLLDVEVESSIGLTLDDKNLKI